MHLQKIFLPVSCHILALLILFTSLNGRPVAISQETQLVQEERNMHTLYFQEDEQENPFYGIKQESNLSLDYSGESGRINKYNLFTVQALFHTRTFRTFPFCYKERDSFPAEQISPCILYSQLLI